MKRISGLIVVIAMIQTVSSFGQVTVLNSNQGLPLKADAGKDTTCVSGEKVIIGAKLSAVNGYGNYIYLWSPATGLDDPTKANPSASPVVSTTYRLTVRDLHHCSAQDEISITVKASGVGQVQDNPEFKVYPNPSGGNLHFEATGFNGRVVMKIINSTGIVVYEIKREVNGLFREELETRFIPSGNYFVVMTGDRGVLSRSIIIN